MASDRGVTSPENPLVIDGFCPICEAHARFIAKGPWLHGTLICGTCENGTVPRERALAHVLKRIAPDWRNLTIHESSPASRISAKLKKECKSYIGSHFFWTNLWAH